MQISPEQLELYRRLARLQGVPEASVDATIRWIFNASVAAIDISWGDYPVQTAVGKAQENAVGTLLEHDRISAPLKNEGNSSLAPDHAGKDEIQDGS